MMRQNLTVGIIAAALAVGAGVVPASARQRSSNGDTVGSAVPRDGGGSSSSSGGSGDSNQPSGGWMQAPPPREMPAPSADRGEAQRRAGGQGSSGQAVPRGSSGSGGSTASSSGSSGGSREGSATAETGRSRDGRNVQGRAVERRDGPARGGGAYYPGIFYDPYSTYYYDPYYSGRYSSYWSPYGYGYGLGYFAYDPYLFGGYGSPYGTPYGAYGGYDPYQGGYGSSGGAGYGRPYRGVGAMKLKVKPSDAQVYVDGYFTGVVDSFDGAFQSLSIEAGAHKIEVRAPGYAPAQFDVMIVPNETVTYKGELKRSH